MELGKFIKKDTKKKEKKNNQIGLLRDAGVPEEYIKEAIEMKKTMCPDWTLKEIVSVWDSVDTRVLTFKSSGEAERAYGMRIAV